jgi:hypothetical protein
LKKRNVKIIRLIFLIVSAVYLPICSILIKTYYSRIRQSIAIKIETTQLSTADTWLPNGIAICTENYNQWYSQICSDGAGGAIITWEDERSGLKGDIYAQKVNSTGDVQWVDNGIAICTENDTQGSPQICNDEYGNAIITWNDKRNGLHYDIYAQKINFTGDLVWKPNGTEICTEGGDQIFPKICSDGAGGAIITWEDSRGIYAQRINSTGDVQWIANGTAICTINNTLWQPQICSDGSGGAIIVWTDYRSGNNFDIYAQRINSTGDIRWIANGTAICTADNDQETPQICSSGTGNAIITWKDLRGTDADIYAQKINSTGDLQWIIDGLVVCTADEDQEMPQICNDGNGGAIITWEDSRDIWGDIYVQRINSNGKLQGNIDGVAICTANLAQYQPQICSDEKGGAIITWFDKRNAVDYDVYAQYIKLEGPQNEDKAFPFELLIIISSVIGGIAIASIITIFILKKRRKVEQ